MPSHTRATVGADPGGPPPLPSLRDEVVPAVGRLARISLIGVLAGALVVGRFTLSGSANLLFVGAALGLLGAGFYFVLRGLMVGPRWFRLLSISIGPAVVTATQIVHTDGVDFTLLEPAWLTIGLFVALPAVYCVSVSVISEAVIDGDRMTSRTWTVLGLLVWIPLAPLLALLLAGRLGYAALRRVRSLRSIADAPVLPWLARTGLEVLFLLAVGSLVGDAQVLV